MTLHREFSEFLSRASVNDQDRALLEKVLDEITPLTIRVANAVHAGEPVIVFGEFCERHRLPPSATMLITMTLEQGGYERMKVSGVRCWVKNGVQFPKLELHRVQLRSRGNERTEQEGFSRHDCVG